MCPCSTLSCSPKPNSKLIMIWGGLAIYCLWGWKNILGLEKSDCWGIRLHEIWFFKICFVYIHDTKILSYFTWLPTDKFLDSHSHLKCKSKQEVYNNYYWISFIFWCHANLSQWFFFPYITLFKQGRKKMALE